MARPTTPLIAADTIIETGDRDNPQIVLIERKNPPYGWALPGGFMDEGELLETTAIREAKEEVCLDVSLTCLLGMYSSPKRDDRGHTVTAVYIARSKSREIQPKAADDAKNVACFALGKWPTPLAFDHALILQDYLNYRETGQVAPIRDRI